MKLVRTKQRNIGGEILIQEESEYKAVLISDSLIYADGNAILFYRPTSGKWVDCRDGNVTEWDEIEIS